MKYQHISEDYVKNLTTAPISPNGPNTPDGP